MPEKKTVSQGKVHLTTKIALFSVMYCKKILQFPPPPLANNVQYNVQLIIELRLWDASASERKQQNIN